MLVYMAFDKKTGRVVHVHRCVDASGQSSTCTEDEVLRTLPATIDPGTVGVTATELDSLPSSRTERLSVDPDTRQVIRTAVGKPSTGKPSVAKRPDTR